MFHVDSWCIEVSPLEKLSCYWLLAFSFLHSLNLVLVSQAGKFIDSQENEGLEPQFRLGVQWLEPLTTRLLNSYVPSLESEGFLGRAVLEPASIHV